MKTELAFWVRNSPRLLLGVDFDGTVAPLVDHAEDAILLPAAKHALNCLGDLEGITLAVISGRDIEGLKSRVGLAGAFYAGNHGLEMQEPGGAPISAPHAEDHLPCLRAALSSISRAVTGLEGVVVEDKGLTATVHYRLSALQVRAKVSLIVADILASHEQLVMKPGKLNWEIRPVIGWNKGTALVRFMEHCGVTSQACAFIGDDVTDFDAFGVLPDGWSFMVGGSPGHPAKSRAYDPVDTAALLRWMASTRATNAGPL